MDDELCYTNEEKDIEWKYQDYSFHLPDNIEQLLEIDNVMQFSVNRARMDLIQTKRQLREVISSLLIIQIWMAAHIIS